MTDIDYKTISNFGKILFIQYAFPKSREASACAQELLLWQVGLIANVTLHFLEIGKEAKF